MRTEELYRDHGRLVAGLCRALLREPAEAEDAAQQVFLSVHRALKQGTAPREPAAWLATIARNECWARIRNRMREPLPTEGVGEVTSLSDPVAEAIRNADMNALWIAIAALPAQQREALLLREFGGLSYEELARALAVSGSAVESLLFRARHGVRTRLEAAYAGIAGASWLETLTRLAGGLGGGMAPVAAKVAVVGVGAAVATGSAVVAPHLLDRPAAKRHVLPRHVTPARRTASALPRPVFVAETRAPIAHIPARAHQNGTTGEPRQNDERPVLAAGHSSDGSDRTTTAERSGGDSGERSDTSRQGRTATAGAEPSSGEKGPSEGGGSDGGEGRDGGDGETTAATTTPAPPVTVDLPATPAPGVPLPGGDG